VKRIARAGLAIATALMVTACGTTPRLASEPAKGANPWPSGSPDATTSAPATQAVPAGPAPCPAGDYQLRVEQALAKTGNYGHVTVDGQQSAEDCATIITFQKRMGIEPADGTPGPTTVDVAERIAATDTTQCPVTTVPIACVDLTHQTFYIAQGGQVVLGPTVTRTGMAGGYATPAGDFPITDRALQTWSVPFKVWLPYWQNFYQGDGLHETTTYIHNMGVGSHGCVNLLHNDAIAAYNLLTYGSTVHLYGHRPGT